MELIIFVLEVLALFSLIMFAGVLDSKYFERKPIKLLDWGIWGLIGFALAALMLSVEGILNKEIMREVWHSAFVCLVCYSWYKFPRLGLKYARQYNFARFFLLSTIVFETLAIVANSWMYGL